MKASKSRTTIVAVRLPPPLLERVDELVGKECVTRAEAVRRMLEQSTKRQEERAA
jgi:metal-responsive CopG/Arc/MetJ family transcriptional regulator